MKPLTILSVFDGISCGQVALQRACIPYVTYYASEIDSHSMRVTLHNFPNTQMLGNIETITGHNLPAIDLLMGGSPCQSFSPAISSNTGFDGKSKLFFEFVRVLRETNPTHFLLENVVMKKEWVDVITNELGVEPIAINSDLFSAQSRPRLYWTNIPIPPLPKGNTTVLKDILETNADEKYFYSESFTLRHGNGVVCADVHINGHDILKRVNSVNHKCQCLTAVCGGNQQKKVIDNGRVRKLTPLEYERLQTLPDNYTVACSPSQRYKQIGNGWAINVIAHILTGIKTLRTNI